MCGFSNMACQILNAYGAPPCSSRAVPFLAAFLPPVPCSTAAGRGACASPAALVPPNARLGGLNPKP